MTMEVSSMEHNTCSGINLTCGLLLISAVILVAFIREFVKKSSLVHRSSVFREQSLVVCPLVAFSVDYNQRIEQRTRIEA